MAKTRSHGFSTGLTSAVALLVVAAPLALVPPAFADEDRDRVAQAQRESAQHVQELRNNLEGLDASLAQVYLDLETANAQIPVAQAEFDTANERYEGAKREHDVAQAQLDAAQAEVARLNTAMEKARKQQEESQKAVGALAREMYQSGGVSSPLLIALSSSGTEEIADRAAAADALTRAQDSALSQAMDMQAVTRNQQSRQDAVTSRISSLEEKARKASEEAENAKNTAETKLRELDELKKTSEEKRAQWDAPASRSFGCDLPSRVASPPRPWDFSLPQWNRLCGKLRY